MIHLPEDLWRGAIDALRTPPHDLELVAFLDGVRLGEDAVITTLCVPPVRNGSRHYSVSSEDMSRAARHLRAHSLRRIAQLHTHPAGWTGHSPEDDRLAYSQRDGALSIVVPNFAGAGTGLGDCGIHIRDADGWLELGATEREALISIVPSTIDLRP